MKTTYNLAALALAFAYAEGAKTAQNDRILVKFCKTKTPTASDCTAPISIYQQGLFTIPAGYDYATSVPTPNEDFFTLVKTSGGMTVSCTNLLTGVKSEDIDPGTQSNGTASSFSISPGKTKQICTNGKCVTCTDYNI